MNSTSAAEANTHAASPESMVFVPSVELCEPGTWGQGDEGRPRVRGARVQRVAWRRACVRGALGVGSGGRRALQRVGVALPGPHADRAIDGRDPDLPVTDLARVRGRGDRVGDLVRLAALAEHLELDLR